MFNNSTYQSIKAALDPQNIEFLAVVKGCNQHQISQLITLDHKCFGENKVQEAISHWYGIDRSALGIKLHLIGHLQSNKIKQAVQIFDTIQTIDSIPLLESVHNQATKLNKTLEYFVQINIGLEPQKHGINPNQLASLLTVANSLHIPIAGLMCIPPQILDPTSCFIQMHKLAQTYKLTKLSMGMSQDWRVAIKHGSTLVRIGSALFT